MINIFCLATGICFFLLIGSYVLDEFGVNSRLKNLPSQYVINSQWRQDNMGEEITTLGPLAKTLRDEYPGLVANYYRFDPVTNIVSVGDKHFRTLIYAGDTTLVSMYGFPLLFGDPGKPFRDNLSAVVTKEFALKFFGKTDIINRSIRIQTPADGLNHDFVVTGVIGGLGKNSVANFVGPAAEVYLPMDANQYFQGGDKGDNWANVFMVSMVELKSHIRPGDLDLPLRHILEKYQPTFVKGNLDIRLLPMSGYYLSTNHGAIGRMLAILSIVALFILLLVIINFINISIGTASYRLKEIGLRKVFGGYRRELIAQFLIESLLITIGSAIVSVLGYEWLRPLFGRILNTSLDHVWQFGFLKIVSFAAVILITGVLAGIYPAFVLSATDTVLAVKGKAVSGSRGLILRKGMLGFQMVLAITVFICTISVSRQLQYIFAKDLGFKKEQVLIISSLPRQWDSAGIVKMEGLKNQLLDIPGVESASLSYDIPDNKGGGYVNIFQEGRDIQPLNMELIATDGDFGKTYKLDLVEGSFFSPNGDAWIPGRVVLNEAAVRSLGWTSAVGKTVRMGALDGMPLIVAGVVKDFHMESVHRKIQPTIIAYVNEPFSQAYRYFSVRLSGNQVSSTIRGLQDQWKKLFPDAGFDYFFMDEKFREIYQSEMQLQNAAGVATVLNFVIVFMGIFGVLSFALTKRSREIAIRKVLGARERNIILLFMREYVLILLIASALAWPIAYFCTEEWLQNFAYRIRQGLSYYFLTAGLVFLASIFLIVLQTLSVALANPVKNLRTE